MRIVSERAQNGKIELDVSGVADGELVTAAIPLEPSVRLTAEERRFLVESIASGEADDGLDACDALDPK